MNSHIDLENFLSGLRNSDDAARLRALQEASGIGSRAVVPLLELALDPDTEVARAAKRALWAIVRQVGRPDARKERKVVLTRLVSALAAGPVSLRSEVLWMLSEIGDGSVVQAVAKLLDDAGLAEPARCCLQRIPGRESTRALSQAQARLAEPMRSALRLALRERGIKMEGPLEANKLPTKQTDLKAL